MHLVLVNRLGALSLPRNSVVRLTNQPIMTIAVYHGSKATKQQLQPNRSIQILTLQNKQGREK